MTEPTADLAATSSRPREILSDPSQVGDRLATLVDAAKHDIVLFGAELEARLFSDAGLSGALAHFAARHQHNRVRILVEDSAQVMHDNERLVTLVRRFSDSVDMREVGESHRGLREVFLVTDRSGYVHQEDTTRALFIVDSRDRRSAALLAERFDSMWAQSEPITGLRTVGI
ncbi:MAG: hypothetical protein JSW09_01220 [Pseudomonadota bacterium]|nr:MAG: hypothetical protein JSW09_01220 [Pseudomonadota bacterium]